MSDKRRVAVVTGGSGGIGRAIAQRLAADGMAVAVHYSGNEEQAADVVTAITESGGSAVAVRADVADDTEVDVLFDTVADSLGGVDVVVNTAGIMILAPVTGYPLEDFDRLVRTNIRGTFVVSQH
ncbi:MAG: 3-ketoacyl-ACP reductase, partial [Mycobacterium sp.]|nr:3-ketoacyl-ACP reductase [Mycobacterium sp.]